MSEETNTRSGVDKWARLRAEFGQRLNPAEQSAVLSWASFTAMFTALRLLTHWIRLLVP